MIHLNAANLAAIALFLHASLARPVIDNNVAVLDINRRQKSSAAEGGSSLADGIGSVVSGGLKAGAGDSGSDGSSDISKGVGAIVSGAKAINSALSASDSGSSSSGADSASSSDSSGSQSSGSDSGSGSSGGLLSLLHGGSSSDDTDSSSSSSPSSSDMKRGIFDKRQPDGGSSIASGVGSIVSGALGLGSDAASGSSSNGIRSQQHRVWCARH